MYNMCTSSLVGQIEQLMRSQIISAYVKVSFRLEDNPIEHTSMRSANKNATVYGSNIDIICVIRGGMAN